MDYEWLGESSQGFYRVWVIHLGRRYGILQALADSKEPLTPERVSTEARLYPQGVKLWCEAAYALGLVSRRAGGYAVSHRMKELLVEETHPDYLGGQFSYLALRSLDYDAFDEFFKEGSRPKDAPHIIEAFKEATKWDHTAFLKLLLPRYPKIKTVFLRESRILDVGSGTGEWIFRISKVYPNPKYTGIESDHVAVERALQRASRQHTSSTRFVQGTAEGMRYSGEFDLVYLGEVLCVMQQRAQAVKKCFDALKPGAFVVVGEGLLEEEDWKGPTSGLMRGMQLDFALQGASFMTRKELTNILGDAGFKGIGFVPAGGGFWFVVARKPAGRTHFDTLGTATSKGET